VQDDTFVLYSEGDDGEDNDRGVRNRSTFMMAGYDLDIDTWTRP
jgi:hypothetical protein